MTLDNASGLHLRLSRLVNGSLSVHDIHVDGPDTLQQGQSQRRDVLADTSAASRNRPANNPAAQHRESLRYVPEHHTPQPGDADGTGATARMQCFSASNPITPSPQHAFFAPATPPPILPVGTHSSYHRCSLLLALCHPLPVALRIFSRRRMLVAVRRTNWLSGRRGVAAGRRGLCAGGQRRRVCVQQPVMDVSTGVCQWLRLVPSGFTDALAGFGCRACQSSLCS
jgi:hypothetical protein